MVGKPSDTRLAVLQFLVTYLESHRYAPTRQEIGEALELNSRSTIQYHIEALVQTGYIERSELRHRMLKPTEKGYAVIAKLRELDGIT